MKTHHRNYAFRPPYRRKERERGPVSLFFRFIRTYVAPFKKLLLVCVLMGVLDYCGSFYLLAYYSKVVIDSILVVSPPTVDLTVKGNRAEKSILGSEREKMEAPKATEKINRQTEIKEYFSTRPPGQPKFMILS